MASKSYSKIPLIVFLLAMLSFGVYRIYSAYKLDAEPLAEMTTEVDLVFDSKANFGKALFFDLRLSSDRSISCATCHVPEKAFTDGKVKSIGVGGREAFRNASTLLNVGDNLVFMFEAHVNSLEKQAIVPIQDSNEMNLSMGDLITRLNEVPHYVKAARQLYDRDLDAFVVTRALASFERTLTSYSSDVDRFLNDKSEGSAELKEGWRLFNELQCIECHTEPGFNNNLAMNNGLYLDYGKDLGRYRIAGDSSMIGAFKVPTLRNVALTAPYMHDGSMLTLEEVVEHYSNGGAGGSLQDLRVKKRDISDNEKKYLITFLNALTDTSYMRDFR
jgi:cytochrome c peroxidase